MANINDSSSEYEGGGLMPNTVFPKETDALTNADKFRLQSITGQEEDSRAPVNPYFWYGNDWPDFSGEKADARARKQRDAQIKRDNSRRYKQSPTPPNSQY